MNSSRGVTPAFSLLLSAAVLVCAAAFAQAADDDAAAGLRIDSIAVGLAGEYKVGRWTRVSVSLSTDKPVRGRLVLVTVDGEGLSTRYTDPSEASVELASGSLTLERYVRFGNIRPELTVEFAAEDGPVTRRHFRGEDVPVARGSTSEFIVVVGQDLGASGALASRPYRQKRVTHVVALKSLAELPSHPLGFDAIDVLTLSTSQETLPAAPPAQWAAMRDWMLLGGRAVISCGKQGEALFGDGGPLQALAPGKFERIGALRRTAALESYAGSAQRLETERSLDQTLFTEVRGRIEASEGSGSAGKQPLILHYPVGLGQMSLITIDLDQPPLSDWPGRPKLMARVLAFHQPGETGKGQGERSSAVPAQLGYHDLSGQLRMALDQFAGVRLVAFSWVALLIAAYIALIGPGDYLFVRFGLRRMQATWVTLGLLSLGFIGLAWWLDARMKSPQVAINQADIIDVDAATGVARGTSWTHIYSPRTAAYTLTPELAPLAPAAATGALSTTTTAIAWQGLPGEGLGGLDGRPAPLLFDSPYDVALQLREGDSPAQVVDVPVQTASTKGLSTQWWRNVAADASIALTTTDDDLLVGSFTYNLDIELEDCAIYHDRFLYRIAGGVKPGRRIELTPTSTSRDLRFHLTQKRVIDAKEIVTPWNARAADTTRILEVMMLHEAAGGDNYTGLTQRFESRIDLSDHLATGRAMLVGRAVQTPVSWQDPQLAAAMNQSCTLVRMIIPVAESAARQ